MAEVTVRLTFYLISLFTLRGKLSRLNAYAVWDDRANGYARGEGIASVVLKTLEQALKDGDQIECIIRETGVNQDGRVRYKSSTKQPKLTYLQTPGITMPSHTAQEILIRETYAKSGLDARKASDRCQFFEAHGMQISCSTVAILICNRHGNSCRRSTGSRSNIWCLFW